jgi:hypothetical protein
MLSLDNCRVNREHCSDKEINGRTIGVFEAVARGLPVDGINRERADSIRAGFERACTTTHEGQQQRAKLIRDLKMSPILIGKVFDDAVKEHATNESFKISRPTSEQTD